MSEIKLEVGQRVRLRNGDVHEVQLASKPFYAGSFLVSPNGKAYDDGMDCDFDVVEILPPEPPTPTVELGKWYPCRDGVHEGKVLEMGLPGNYSYAGIRRLIKNPEYWCPESWRATGASCFGGPPQGGDLMLTPPAPKRHTVTYWANCYVKSDGKAIFYGQYLNKEDADRRASPNREACVPYTIEFTEGEGLP